MMEYKGYIGDARIDPEAEVIRGRVINTRDMITFQGASVAEATAAFRESVDDYLEFCASRGESPDRPFSGKFLIRMSPTSHRVLALEARRRGVSLNKLAGQALLKLARSASRPGGASSARETYAPAAARPSGGVTVYHRPAATGKLKRIGAKEAQQNANPGPGSPSSSRDEEAANDPSSRRD